MTLFCQPGPVRNYEDAKRSDTARYAGFFHHMLERGIYLAPSQFEAMFLSAAHTEADVDRVIEAVQGV
jgi:glutamate-1-semialdehyde 2,1-aminomutase